MTTATLVSALALPSQFSFSGSYFACEASPQQRLERNAALRRADMEPVLGGDVGDVIGHHEAAAAGHVLHHTVGLPGTYLPKYLATRRAFWS